MANGGQVTYGINFNVDQSGLEAAKRALHDIQSMSLKDMHVINPDISAKDFVQIRQQAESLSTALKRSFNTALGSLNVNTLNNELGKLNLTSVYNSFNKLGATGRKAFRDIAIEATTTNNALKRTSGFLDKMGQTMINTAKWGIASRVMNDMTGAVQQAYGYVKSLDTSLNDIRIVTGKSAEEMDKFAVKANKAAQAIGKSTTDYTNASLIYYQQGLSDEEVEARTATTLKAASVTGQDTAAVSEQLTAVWNGFQIDAANTELAVDKLAAVAASTASDLEELASGMSKVAAAGNALGVTEDQLAAQLSTIVSVTREAPESVGTAMKTILARMADLKIAGGEDEFGATLGDVSSKMAAMGVNILDETGALRDMGGVIEEVGEKWQGWTENQRIAAAQALAGKRQYNNLIALFDNWDEYLRALNTSMNAQGTIEEQNQIYLESLKAKTEQYRAAIEDLEDSLLDSNSFKGMLEGLTKGVNLLADFVDAIGGGGNALLGFTGIIERVFSKQIASEIGNVINNIRVAKQEVSTLEAQAALNTQFGITGKEVGDKELQQMTEMTKKMLEVRQYMSDEDFRDFSTGIQSFNEIASELDRLTESTTRTDDALKRLGSETMQELLDAAGGNAEVALAELENHLMNLAPEATDAQDALHMISESASSLLTGTERLNNALKRNNFKDFAKDEKVAGQAIKDLFKDFESLSNAGAVFSEGTKQSFQELNQAIKAISGQNYQDTAGTTIGKALKQDTEEANKLKLALDNVLQNLHQDGQLGKVTIEQLGQAIELLASGKVNDLHEALQKVGADLQDINKKGSTTQTIQGYVTALSNLQSVLFAIQQLNGLKNIITNDDLSTMEKAEQVIMSLTSALLMLLPAIGAFTESKLAISVAESITAITGLGISAAGLAGILGGVAVAIAVAGAAIDHFVVTADEAREEFEKLDGQTKTTQNELQSLQGELKTNQDRIQDLLDQDELTLMDQQEIEKLRQSNRLLERQIELKERELELSLRERADAATTDIEKSGLNNYSQESADIYQDSMENHLQHGGLIVNPGKDNLEANIGYLKAYQKELAELEKNPPIDANDTKAVQEYNKKIDEYNQKVTEYERNLLNQEIVLETLISSLEELDDVKGLNSFQQNQLDQAKNTLTSIYNAVDEQQGQQYQYDDFVKGLSNQALDEYDQIYKAASESAEGVTQQYVAQFGTLVQKAKESGLTIQQLVQQINKEAANIDPAFANFSQVLDNITSQGLKNFASGAGGGDFGYFERLGIQKLQSEDDLKQFFGLDNTQLQSLLEATGYEDGEAFIAAIQKAIDESDIRMDNLADKVDTGEIEVQMDQLADKIAELQPLQTIYNKIANGKGVDWKALNNTSKNGFKTLFGTGELIDEYKNLMAVIGKAPDDLAQQQAAWDALIKKWITTSEEFKGINKENADSVKGMFRDLGITNADEVVDSIMEVNKASRTLDQQLSKLTPKFKKYREVLGEFASGGKDFDTKQLKEAEDVLTRIVAAVTGLKTDEVGNLFDISKLAQDEESLRLVEDALNGVEGGVERLKAKIAELNAQEIKPEARLDWSQFEADAAALLTYASQLNPDVTGEADLKVQAYLAALATMLSQAGYTASQIESIFNSLNIPNITPHVEMQKVPVRLLSVSGGNSVRVSNADKKDAEGNARMRQQIAAVEATPYNDYIEVPKVTFEKTGASATAPTVTNPSMGNSGGSGGGGGKGKKGGGGKGSTYEAPELEYEKKKLDKYHDLNVELEKYQHNLTMIQKLESHAVGKALIKNLQEQIKAYKQLANTQQKISNKEEKDLNKQQQKLLKKYGKKGLSFEKDGSITDKAYNKLLKEQQKNIKKMYDDYNAAREGMSKEDAEAAKKAIKKEEKKYDKMKANLDNYESIYAQHLATLEKLTDYYLSINEAKWKAFSAAAEEYGYEMAAAIDKWTGSLKQLELQMNRLSRAQNKLMGNSYISNLQEQNALLEEQNEIYAKQANAAQKTMDKIESTYGGSGKKVTYYTAKGKKKKTKVALKFDEDGNITNSAKLLKKAKSAEEREAIQSVIDEYNNALETWVDKQDAMEENLEQMLENRIEAYHYTIEMQIDYHKLQKEWKDFEDEFIKRFKQDTIQGISQLQRSNVSYLERLTGTILPQAESNLAAATEHWQNALAGNDSVYGDNAQKAYEHLLEAMEEYETSVEEVYEMAEAIRDEYYNTIELVKEHFDLRGKFYTNLESLINHDIKMMQLLDGKVSGRLNAEYDQLQKNYAEQVKLYSKQADMWERLMKRAEMGTEDWKKFYDYWMEATEQMNTALENQVQNALNKMTNQIELAYKNITAKFQDGTAVSYSQLSEAWELQRTNAERYLDEVNKAYNIEQLRLKYLESINDLNDNKSAQTKLNELMEDQISMLRNSVQLRQYDVDRAEKLYQIALKQIALEEAQNNKSKMRLQRDSQGNYTYRYVQDTDAVNKATQELLAAENELYNLDKKQRAQDMSDQLKAYTDYLNKMKQLDIDYYINRNLTQEQYDYLSGVYRQEYNDLIDNLAIDLNTDLDNLNQSTFMNLKALYDNHAQVDLPEFEYAVLNSWDIMKSAGEGSIKAIDDAEKEYITEQVLPRYLLEISEMVNATEDFSDRADAAFDEVRRAGEDLNDQLEELNGTIDYEDESTVNAIIDAQEALDDFIYSQEEAIMVAGELADMALEQAAAVSELSDAYWAAKEAIDEYMASLEAAQEMESDLGDDDDDDSGKKKKKKKTYKVRGTTSDPVKITQKATLDKNGNPKLGKKTTSTPKKTVKVKATSKKQAKKKAKKKGIAKVTKVKKLATGGYTGDWAGEDGRIAMLHKKELVLNKVDTENFLAAVDIVRSISDRLGGLAYKVNESSTFGTTPSTNVSEENNYFTIHADFPGVSTAKQIELAFDNLKARASQVAAKR